MGQEGNIRPFLGGGIALIKAEIDVSLLGITVTEDDTGVGIWIDTGIYIILAEHFNIGVEAAFSKAEVTIVGIDGEAGGLHLGVLAGYH